MPRDILSRLAMLLYLLLGSCQLSPWFELVENTPVQQRPEFSAEACPFTIPTGFRVQCGTVMVPENRADPAGRRISIAVAVVRVMETKPGGIPVVFLNGGPGDLTLGFFEDYADRFKPLLAERPFIFFDQRGIGYSRPSLDCPEVSLALKQLMEASLPHDEMVNVHQDAYRLCRARLVEAGVDLDVYTTAASAADVRDIVQSLRHKKVYLLGVSYGTQLAQVAISNHQDEGWIAGAILDSVVPLEKNELLALGANSQEAVFEIFERCEADPKCRGRYPTLREDFFEIFQQVSKAPLVLEIYHPQTMGLVKTTLSADEVFSILHSYLFNRYQIMRIPQLIDQLHAGSSELLRRTYERGLRNSDCSCAGLRNTILCADEQGQTQLAQVIQANATLTPPFRDYFNRFTQDWLDRCVIWNVAPDGADNQPLETDLPVLLLAGEHDPLTPPKWAAQMHARLPSAYLYIFPAASHGVMSTPGEVNLCAKAIVKRFLANPDLPPADGCIDDLKPITFYLR